MAGAAGTPRADEGAQDIVRTGETASEGSSRPASAEQIHELIALQLAEHDKAAAVRTAVEAVEGGAISIPTLYQEVLWPLLSHTGQAWQGGQVRIWEEHFASAVVRTIVEMLYPSVLKVKATVPASGRSVLLACPPEEVHDLGLRMVADRFDMAGWATYYLGADTPPSELVDAARRLGVDAVVISSSTHFHRVALRHHIHQVKEELGNVQVWVGGSAFAHSTQGWSSGDLLDLEELLGEARSVQRG
jgi:methanogenic corrinoid protein MtbC1